MWTVANFRNVKQYSDLGTVHVLSVCSAPSSCLEKLRPQTTSGVHLLQLFWV